MSKQHGMGTAGGQIEEGDTNRKRNGQGNRNTKPITGTGRRENVEKTKPKINPSGFFHRVWGKQKTTKMRQKSKTLRIRKETETYLSWERDVILIPMNSP